ncbi:hypothetical protein [Flexibacterium corallicola]|uniref:hypothetical protein n=1 Tax=Flexibacterium corallicola TaxID=3037259 RepID=UPI00286F31BB|nr:hypothetical protein [Pseudovibrio sp. M1P-2-3]
MKTADLRKERRNIIVGGIALLIAGYYFVFSPLKASWDEEARMMAAYKAQVMAEYDEAVKNTASLTEEQLRCFARYGRFDRDSSVPDFDRNYVNYMCGYTGKAD